MPPVVKLINAADLTVFWFAVLVPRPGLLSDRRGHGPVVTQSPYGVLPPQFWIDWRVLGHLIEPILRPLRVVGGDVSPPHVEEMAGFVKVVPELVLGGRARSGRPQLGYQLPLPVSISLPIDQFLLRSDEVAVPLRGRGGRELPRLESVVAAESQLALLQGLRLAVLLGQLSEWLRVVRELGEQPILGILGDALRHKLLPLPPSRQRLDGALVRVCSFFRIMTGWGEGG